MELFTNVRIDLKSNSAYMFWFIPIRDKKGNFYLTLILFGFLDSEQNPYSKLRENRGVGGSKRDSNLGVICKEVALAVQHCVNQ